MTYQEATEYLFEKTANYEKQGTLGYKPGLDTMLAMDKHYGHPHTKYRTIHVAGTNGKGSVSHSIAALLQMCGYKVGLYTSPHLVDFRERIRINGTPISEEEVTRFVDNERVFFEKLKPTFFELTTMLALRYFAEQDVDIAVIETGLGGRMDSTNIIQPLVSIITNVSLDHTQLLGSTVERIAAEKAGIMKKGVPCVIGETTPKLRSVYNAIAAEKGATVVYAEDPVVIATAEPLPQGKGIQYETIYGIRFQGELQGECQKKNMNTVLHATKVLMDLGYLCDCENPENIPNIEKEMTSAFMNVTKLTGLQGRWQTIRNNPTVVCDTGHNPGAWEYLSRQLGQIQCHELRIVIGILEDKDVYAIMSKLPKKAIYYFARSSSHRSMSEATLKVFADQFGLRGNSYPSVAEAYKDAISGAVSDDFIFVGGSNYVVSDFLKTRI